MTNCWLDYSVVQTKSAIGPFINESRFHLDSIDDYCSGYLCVWKLYRTGVAACNPSPARKRLSMTPRGWNLPQIVNGSITSEYRDKMVLGHEISFFWKQHFKTVNWQRLKAGMGPEWNSETQKKNPIISTITQYFFIR